MQLQFGKVDFLLSRGYSNPQPVPNLQSSIATRLRLSRASSPGVLCPSRSVALRCQISAVDMDSSGSLGVYPLHRCKTIHLVRHAQGFHNVEGEKDNAAYLSPHLFDASLTPLGFEQVDNLHKHVHSSGLFQKVELVVTSPLMRTMQTAVGVFGGTSSPPFLAMELCREHIGVHWCDKRRPISEYKPSFPGIDFSLIEDEDDMLWKEDIRETNEEVSRRGLEFLKWLWTRKEKEIAVVTHSGFLIHTLSGFGNDCHPTVKSEICRPFKNCELRSIVIADKCMVGSD